MAPCRPVGRWSYPRPRRDATQAECNHRLNGRTSAIERSGLYYTFVTSRMSLCYALAIMVPPRVEARNERNPRSRRPLLRLAGCDMHLVRNAMAGGLLRKGLRFVDHRDATLIGSALLVVAVLGESVVPARAVGICGNNNFIPVQDPGATGGINCVAPGQANQSSQSSQSNLGSIGVVVDGISQAAMSPVESELQSIRDQIQSGKPAAGRGPRAARLRDGSFGRARCARL
jgi:hypothetical protein